VASLQGRALPLLLGPLAVFAALAGLTLAAGGRAGPTAPCAEPRPRDLPGEAVELTAGEGIWSAWITYPPVAGETITVLWRAAGFVQEDLKLRGGDVYGHHLAVEFGPSPVLPQLRGGGLQWPRTGREWGSRVLFSHPGCWRLKVDAGGRPGELTLWVRR
jgi:hypothetical protein